MARARKSGGGGQSEDAGADIEDDEMASAAFAKAGRSGKTKGVKRSSSGGKREDGFVRPPALGASVAKKVKS